MNCIDKETLQDFIDEDLPEIEAQKIAEHIRSCKACKLELQEILSLEKMLNKIVNEDKCPSFDELEKYVNKTLKTDKISDIEKHIDLCSHCRFYAWALGATQQELTDWQAKEESEYREFCEKDLGLEAAKNTLTELLPDKMDILDNYWGAILTFVLDLKEKAVQNWPSFGSNSQVAGVLGFAETSDPQTDAASIITTTAIYVSQLVSDGKIKPNTKDIEMSITEVATKLGAGTELRKRLIEIVPPIILKLR